MYQKAAKGWLKHWDFMLLDVLALQFAFVIAYFIRVGLAFPYYEGRFSRLALILLFIQIAIFFFNDTFKGVLRRGYYYEFTNTVKTVFMVFAMTSIFLFVTQEGINYSRLLVFYTCVIYFFMSLGVRYFLKAFLKKHPSPRWTRKTLFIVTTPESVEKLFEDGLKSLSMRQYRLVGVGTTNVPAVKAKLKKDWPVVTLDEAVDFVNHNWVDEVFIDLPESNQHVNGLIDCFIDMGVTVHFKLAKVLSQKGKKQTVEKVLDYTVLTTSMNIIGEKQLLYKRTMDIVGGLVGVLITVVATIFVAPLIYIQSPGPIFFSQERVGRNGKPFKMYKLRSMYMDAEKRKKQLMAKNRIKDGLMFKMEDDPRIIGSGKDGKGKGIGHFIRKTSIDELPQFFNVLKGEMSLVGTRPPTMDEWKLYDQHHRARLSTKPGITGIWQVSGRSNITDFEKVVQMDTDYIKNWTIGTDIRIIFQTIGVIFKSDEGAM